jgi:hypothetical protein
MIHQSLFPHALATLLLFGITTASVAGDGESGTIGALAGNYYYGDGLAINCSLVVKPEGRFSFRWRGCLGLYGMNEGSAKIESNHLILTPEQPNDSTGFGGTLTDFVVVRWGDRLYLIPKEDGKRFCNEVKLGREPRSKLHGSFYLRRGDCDKKVTGLPTVPKEWESWLQKQPLERVK